MAELRDVLDQWSLIAALSMGGFAANPSIVSNAALRSRPFAGLKRHGERIRCYLAGSYLCAEGGPRHLQDPLSFRSLPLLHGTAADSMAFAYGQGGRAAVVELMVAAQAVEIRKAIPLGAVTGKLHALVREVTPFAAAGDRGPHLDPPLRHLRERRDALRSMLEPA
ncbi:MAG: hypothetical protein EOP23_16135 [Hyphomicrobiales bacterium]|nr:MAG: hypothetical protein EOP23_16135 [Hyphomicrobiales bacterium]